jgi:hypothetical protein
MEFIILDLISNIINLLKIKIYGKAINFKLYSRIFKIYYKKHQLNLYNNSKMK